MASRLVKAMESQFSISDMLGSGPGHPREKANGFSGIAHNTPPGGKCSIDFSFGAYQHNQPSNPYQTSSRAATAAADLSYQLQLSNPSIPAIAGRRLSGQNQGQSINLHQVNLSPRAKVSNCNDGSVAPGMFTSSGQAMHLSTPLTTISSTYQQPYGAFPAAALNSNNSSSGISMDWQYPAGSNSYAGSAWDAAGGVSLAGSRYSPQMQQLMAQQQQFLPYGQQTDSRTSSRCGSMNGAGVNYGYASGSGALDMCSSTGGISGQYSYGTPRGAALSTPGLTAANWAAAAPVRTNSAGRFGQDKDCPVAGVRSQPTSSLYASSNASNSFPVGLLSSTAAQQGYMANAVPKPAACTPPFTASKGVFCGKTIMQPPGGKSTFNLFGG